MFMITNLKIEDKFKQETLIVNKTGYRTHNTLTSRFKKKLKTSEISKPNQMHLLDLSNHKP